jgi:hypothetical protein
MVALNWRPNTGPNACAYARNGIDDELVDAALRNDARDRALRMIHDLGHELEQIRLGGAAELHVEPGGELARWTAEEPEHGGGSPPRREPRAAGDDRSNARPGESVSAAVETERELAPDLKSELEPLVDGERADVD